MMLAPEMAVYTEEDGMEPAGPLTLVDGPVEYFRSDTLARQQALLDRALADSAAEKARADRLEEALRNISSLRASYGNAEDTIRAMAGIADSALSPPRWGSGLDNTYRLMLEAAERLGGRDER